MNSNLLTMALQLSTQDIFSGSWFSSALMNKAWTEILRSSVNGISRNTNADLLGAALGGRLRGDAAMLRQAAANVGEARAMMGTAAAAAGTVAGQIKEAQKLAEDFAAATQGMSTTDPGYPALLATFQKQYASISGAIDSIITNTAYNGIALLDGTAWGGDERLSVTRNAANEALAASVHIQAGESGFPLAFSNMGPEFLKIADKHTLTDTNTGLPRPDAVTELSALQRSAHNLADFYAGRAGSLQSQASSLQSQATILEEAAAVRAKSPEPVSPESLLLNLALRDTGSLFNLKS